MVATALVAQPLRRDDLQLRTGIQQRQALHERKSMGIHCLHKVYRRHTYRIDGPGALPVPHHANADAAASLLAHEFCRRELRMLADEGVQRDVGWQVGEIHWGMWNNEYVVITFIICTIKNTFIKFALTLIMVLIDFRYYISKRSSNWNFKRVSLGTGSDVP